MRRIQMLFELPYEVHEDEDWHVASCDTLDVHSQGRSEEEAVHNLREALILFLTSCLERGVLEKVLKDAGFSVQEGVSVAEPGQKVLDIPLSLTDRGQDAQADPR